jgi:NitT/TauT family transport system ATP-binding protein
MEKAILIQIEGLHKEFITPEGERLKILKDINFYLKEGEILTLIGPSGCGKSTILNIIASLIPATEGRVILKPGLKLGYIFQEPRLLPWRTVFKNVQLGLEDRGLKAAEMQEKIRKYLRLTGLADFENKYPHELSGGMQQRVALCRALVIEPSVLLMDEPFAALDAITRQHLESQVVDIVTKTGKSVIMVTHDIDEALVMADRIIVMGSHPGRIEEILEVDFPRPRSLKTLTFSPRYMEMRAHLLELLRKELVRLGKIEGLREEKKIAGQEEIEINHLWDI